MRQLFNMKYTSLLASFTDFSILFLINLQYLLPRHLVSFFIYKKNEEDKKMYAVNLLFVILFFESFSILLGL